MGDLPPKDDKEIDEKNIKPDGDHKTLFILQNLKFPPILRQ